MSNVIYLKRQMMSKQELSTRCQLVTQGIKTIRVLNPPRLCGEEKGELVDEMNQLLVDLFQMRKRFQELLREA